MSYWQGKVAIITGGSAGFGRVLAGAFAEASASVVLVARGAEGLQREAAALEAQGHQVLAVEADVTVEADVHRMIDLAVDRFGRLDVLVNCAGRSSRGRVLDTTPEAFQDLWELNFLAAVRCTRAAAPHLLKSRGHVVNIASLAAKVAAPYLAAYPASKFSLAAYSQQLRLELGPEGLHILLVCPGPIARDDAQIRYMSESSALPEKARLPGAGAKIKSIDPVVLSRRILRGCERRQAELIVPRKARLLFALGQVSPMLGDWVLKKITGDARS